MNTSEIVAVVVSYNGGDKTVRTIESLLGYVGHVLVIDNASDSRSISLLQAFQDRAGVSVLLLENNCGIGYALNRGVEFARSGRYRWILTMDQDSVADASMLLAYGNAVDRNPDLACLAATLVFRASSRPGCRSDVSVKYAITSGNLVRLDVYERAGLYDEDMFIDHVDFDFSLRARKAGYDIRRVAGAYLYHEIGEAPPPRGFLGRFHTYHSPLRRYYAYRNFLYLAQRHGRAFPGFIAKLAVVHAILIATIAIYGRERARSLLYIGRGTLDFLRNRTGPYEKLR